MLLPLFQRYAVDNFIEQRSLQGFQTFIVGYLAVIVLQVLSFVFYTLSAMKMEMCMGRDLKRGALSTCRPSPSPTTTSRRSATSWPG